MDDMLPRTALEAARNRQTRAWTGDVWKVTAVLEQRRPDLVLVPVAVRPTGFLVVLCPDPEAPVGVPASAAADMRRLRKDAPPPESVLGAEPRRSTPPSWSTAPFWETVRAARTGAADADTVRREVVAWRPRPLSPEQVAESKGSARRRR